jgi:hypothetical protein
MIPLRNVPLARITAFALISSPIPVLMPVTLFPSVRTATTISCQKSRFAVFSSISLHFIEKSILSFCARGLHIAGPFDLLSILNCIVVWSVTIPEYPPIASISRIICPFAMPPIAGLHDIWAILLMFMVMSNTFEPSLAAAAAASLPA